MGETVPQAPLRHNQLGSVCCPFSVKLCIFEVAPRLPTAWPALTGEKQRERIETGWVMMASGLHIWSQFPPTLHNGTGWRGA